jgi:nucleoside-diphosphate-sugar epimerase
MTTAFVTGGSGFVGRNLIPYLTGRGVAVRALARSDAAADAVTRLGAVAVRGDLAGPIAPAPLRGVDVVYHSGAFVDVWGDEREAFDINVNGTQRVLDAARAAGVPRFVHVSTEAVLIGGPKLRRADESWPRPRRPIGLYPRTKGQAEERVEAANRDGLATIIVRPRFIWGAGDTTLLPALIEATHDGALRWVAGGRHLTSMCHVRNVCEGLVKAAERGAPGGKYFLTDGAPVEFRGFIEAMLRARGVEPPTKSVPHAVAKAYSYLSTVAARALGLGRPRLPYTAFLLIGEEVTVDDSRARRELGYVAETTRDEGLRELAAARIV